MAAVQRREKTWGLHPIRLLPCAPGANGFEKILNMKFGNRKTTPIRLGVFFCFWLVVFPVTALAQVDLKVTGVEGKLLDNVEEALAFPSGLIQDNKVNLRWLERFQKTAPQKVASALEPFGYYGSQTVSELTALSENHYRLSVRIDPGLPVRIRTVRLDLQGEGAGKKELTALAGRFPLRTGDILDQDAYERAKTRIRARAVDLGYLAADFKVHEIRIHQAERWAEIELTLDTGPEFRFGPVSFQGAPAYPEAFLKRYQAFRTGDVFSHARLGETQMQLLDSDRFKDVAVVAREDAAVDRRVPIDVNLTPSARIRLRPGVGYGTDTGARFSLRYKDLDAFHLGHELTADLLVAELMQSLTAAYIIPDARDLKTYSAVRAGNIHEELDTYETRSLFAEIEHVRSLGKGQLGSVFVRLLEENSKIGEVEDFDSRVILPGVRYSRRGYPSLIRPRKGYYVGLEVRGAHKNLGSDTDLFQCLGSGNFLMPLPGRFSLFARFEGGATLYDDPFSSFPVSLRFFAGGDQSVRGYAYQSLGPKSGQEVVGGKHLAVGSLEIERAVGKDWGAAVFYDAGNAFDSPSEMDLAQSVGIGVRYYTLIGPIKIDLARQIDRDNPSYRLHVSMGFGW